MPAKFRIPSNVLDKFAGAVHNTDPVSGLTHNFYRYPARFSPQFAREAILAFSKPGDVVLDPFMGGGTTLVEALVANRHSIGCDVSPLATFISRAKTTPLSENDLRGIAKWAEKVVSETRTTQANIGPSSWTEAGYQKDVSWPIRKSVESILDQIGSLPRRNQRQFATCVLLRTAQWAIDCRDKTPRAEDFRLRFQQNIEELSDGMREFQSALVSLDPTQADRPQCLCLNRSATDLEDCAEIKHLPAKPKLVITSPPYPGVHVIYHQWQVHSRKRTPAPFWIIGSLDGHGSSHYTFGYYKRHLRSEIYFETALKSFTAIRSVIDDEAAVVQLVGFSDPRKSLPKYLNMMSEAGFAEVVLSRDAAGRVRRLWRNIPNRRWYADSKDDVSSSKEVLLVHRPA